jgi:uncharacterized membrane protein YfhO
VKPSAQPSEVKNEVRKLSKHIGLIEGEVSEITKRYNELKESKDEPTEEESVQVKTDDQQKIEKFASMLKTLNQFKSEYKTANKASDKKSIHKKISDFTQKWLDAKNLQLSDQIQTN